MRRRFSIHMCLLSIFGWAALASFAHAAQMTLSTPGNQPVCLIPGQNISIQLRVTDLPRPVVGYQAFLRFDSSLLQFVSGSYSLPNPFGLPIIMPIAANGDDIDLAAGINQFTGQQPTQANALLATLTFQARPIQGVAHVAFRPHDPPSQFADNLGDTIQPDLIDAPQISISATSLDSDGDGWFDGCDNCPQTSNANQLDSDADGVGDACDVCPGTIPHAPVDAQGCPPFVPADFDRDGDVDSVDYLTFHACSSRANVPHPPAPPCAQADFDGDGDVDPDDMGTFQRYFSGTDQLAHHPLP